AAVPLDFRLGLDAFVVTLRIKPTDPAFHVPLFRRDRRRRARLRAGAGVANSIDPAATPARSLHIRPIHDDQRTVAFDNEVGGFETIVVVGRSAGEVNLFERSESTSLTLRAIAHHGSAPLTEK